ncbi:hypothetical protein HanLR1_Chr14g0531991 [Helianthus annuus]|nr:hypothetical protein HanHA89_Chr14g0569601 [Helianthus annuus]KAJ0656101.1 hypothetical protein HanLR1_Chr14g0531991 [Helianthus annuus]
MIFSFSIVHHPFKAQYVTFLHRRFFKYQTHFKSKTNFESTHTIMKLKNGDECIGRVKDKELSSSLHDASDWQRSPSVR